MRLTLVTSVYVGSDDNDDYEASADTPEDLALQLARQEIQHYGLDVKPQWMLSDAHLADVQLIEEPPPEVIQAVRDAMPAARAAARQEQLDRIAKHKAAEARLADVKRLKGLEEQLVHLRPDLNPDAIKRRQDEIDALRREIEERNVP